MYASPPAPGTPASRGRTPAGGPRTATVPDRVTPPVAVPSPSRCIVPIHRPVGPLEGEMLEFAILGLLQQAPMHGYELRKQLAEVLGGLRSISYGSLYPALKRLHAAGAACTAPPDRRALLPAGAPPPPGRRRGGGRRAHH